MKLKIMMCFCLAVLSSGYETYAQDGIKWAGQDTVSCGEAGVMIGYMGTDPKAANACYQWSPSTGLSCTDCRNPVASPKHRTQYTVKVVANDLSWSATDNVWVDLSMGEMKFNPPYLERGTNVPVEAYLMKINSTSIEWSILGDPLGCHITGNGATASISPGNTHGSITVQAENLETPGCIVKEEIDINVGVKDVEAEDVQNPGRIARNGETLYIINQDEVLIRAIPNEGGFDDETPDWKNDLLGSRKLEKGQVSGILSENHLLHPIAQYIAGKAPDFEPLVTVHRESVVATTVMIGLQDIPLVEKVKNTIDNTNFNSPVKVGSLDVNFGPFEASLSTIKVGKYKNPDYGYKVNGSLTVGMGIVGKLYYPPLTRTINVFTTTVMTEVYISAGISGTVSGELEYDPSKESPWSGQVTGKVSFPFQGGIDGSTATTNYKVETTGNFNWTLDLVTYKPGDNQVFGYFESNPVTATIGFTVKSITDPAVKKRLKFGGSFTYKLFESFRSSDSVVYEINN